MFYTKVSLKEVRRIRKRKLQCEVFPQRVKQKGREDSVMESCQKSPHLASGKRIQASRYAQLMDFMDWKLDVF